MREIKFRIWDSKYLTFDYNASPELFISTEGEVFEKDTVNFAMQTYDEYNKMDHYKISQFTGLYDKTGNEIYEDDIILVEGRTQFRIYYSVNSACYRAVRIRDGWHFDIKELFPIDYWKIVGNIYENPELLEVENV